MTPSKHLTPSERREFLQEMIEEVVVHPDRIDVALFEGTRSSVRLENALGRKLGKRGGGSGGSGGEGGGGGETPAGRGGKVRAVPTPVRAGQEAARTGEGPHPTTTDLNRQFVYRVDWLP